MPTINLTRKITVRSFTKKKNLLAHLPAAAAVESGAKTELTEVQKLFRESRAKAADQKEAVTNAGHYLVLCFGSEARKAAFLQAMKLDAKLDKFADGQTVADALGVELPPLPKLVSAPRRPMKSTPLIRDLPE